MFKYWLMGSFGKRGMHWQAHDKMVVSKVRGGLNSQHWQIFNDAMLAKQAWRPLEQPIACVHYKGKILLQWRVSTSEVSSKFHFDMEGDYTRRKVLMEDLIRRVGDGLTT